MLGTLARHAGLAIKNRHLGLVQAREHAQLDERLEALATLAEQGIDLDALERAALPSQFDTLATPRIAPPGQRIALASDDAFSFIYPHLLAGWRAAGAEIVPFSPLADEGARRQLRRRLAAGRLSRTPCRHTRRGDALQVWAHALRARRARCMANAEAT